VDECFVLPRDRRSPTGGTIYNRSLLRALGRSGWSFEIVDLPKALQRDRPARFWVDSLYLKSVPDLHRRCADGSSIRILVHYLPSLVAELPAERQTWRRVETRAFRCAQAFVVTSDFAGAELATRGLGDRPSLVLPPAPSVRRVPVRPRDPDRFRGLMVANLVPGKGILEFLSAFDAALHRRERFSLEIAGRTDMDPAYARECRRVIAEGDKLRGRIRLLGTCGPTELRRAYLRNAFFVSASRMESFGMALQDARVFGLYLLVRSGGFATRHLRTASDGVGCDSAQELARIASRLISSTKDRAQLLREVQPMRTDYDWNEAARRFREWARIS